MGHVQWSTCKAAAGSVGAVQFMEHGMAARMCSRSMPGGVRLADLTYDFIK